MDIQSIEQALKQLTVDELDAVLDALTLVVEYATPVATKGIYLVPPHGELIADGKQKYIVKPRPHDITGNWVLVSGKSAYGIITIGHPDVVDTKEFDGKYTDHRVSRKSRLQWWPDKNHLWMYPVEVFWPYPQPRDVYVRPGTQTVIEDVQFDDKSSASVRHDSVIHDTVRPLSVQILHSDDEAQRGFSNRRDVQPHEGLLIPMHSTRGIWMKDTGIPINVAFLDEDYKVLSVVELVPYDETVYLGPERTAWALEAVPSWFEAANVQIGDVITGLPTTE